MRILLVTDAWKPQVNGVVRTLEALVDSLSRLGVIVEVVAPNRFFSVPCPTYPEIRLALTSQRRFSKIAEAFNPDAIHIATEGPLGYVARSACVGRGWAFTTAFHTRFPEYLYARWKIPTGWTLELMRRFHAPSSGVMAATQTLEDELAERGFRNIARLGRGVDTSLFSPGDGSWAKWPRPILLNVGRVSAEKNIPAFLELNVSGTKLIVGDGPARQALERRFPEAVFVGAKTGKDLARYYCAADCFVFPSRTDTFGLVMLEALACGVPVAAFPVAGPIDVVTSPKAGVLRANLAEAVSGALNLRSEDCRRFALRHDWDAVARQFLRNVRRKGN